MTKEHEGLPVKGYQPQSQGAVDLVNEHKVMEEHLLQRLDDLTTLANTQAGVGEKQVVDRRWIAIAATHFQEGFMALNRAVFQPARLILGKDPIPENKQDEKGWPDA